MNPPIRAVDVRRRRRRRDPRQIRGADDAAGARGGPEADAPAVSPSAGVLALSRDDRLIDHQPRSPSSREVRLDPSRRTVEAELKRPRMKAEMDEDLQAGRRADVFQVRPADEVLQPTERPQPKAPSGSHGALPPPRGPGQRPPAGPHQEAPGELGLR